METKEIDLTNEEGRKKFFENFPEEVGLFGVRGVCGPIGGPPVTRTFRAWQEDRFIMPEESRRFALESNFVRFLWPGEDVGPLALDYLRLCTGED